MTLYILLVAMLTNGVKNILYMASCMLSAICFRFVAVGHCGYYIPMGLLFRVTGLRVLSSGIVWVALRPKPWPQSLNPNFTEHDYKLLTLKP